MRIHIVACRVFMRELSYYAAQSSNIIEISWLPQGLHATPKILHRMLSETLDTIYRQIKDGVVRHSPDVSALCYGLCSGGVVGLAAKDIPLVVPRTDDCIGIFLGSQETYLEKFEDDSGIYWLNNGWIESSFDRNKGWQSRLLRKYTELYGADNAAYLLEAENAWVQNYHTCGFITSPVYHNPAYPALARRFAEENGWKYAETDGNMRLIEQLTRGAFDEKEFLICPPGYRIAATYDASKFCAQKE